MSTEDLHATARRVVVAAAAAGLHIDVAEFPEGTRTAEQAAAAVGCEVARIVKSLVFLVDGSPVLALVGGDARLDEDLLSEAAGGSVRRADADLVRAATGYAIGGVPPFGHATALRTFLDLPLLRHGTVWAAAGTPRHVFEADPRDLVRVAGAQVTPLSRPLSRG